MAFFIMSPQATQSALKTVQLRHIIGLAAGAAVCLTAIGFAAGFVVARQQETRTPGTILGEANTAEDKFVVNRLGEIVGRMYRLESEAQNLAKRIGSINEIERKTGVKASMPSLTTVTGKAAEGGPLMIGNEAQVEWNAVDARQPLDLGLLLQQLDAIDAQLSQVDRVATMQSIDFMALPTVLPVNNSLIGSGFGYRRDPFTTRLAFHSGLDFPAPTGTEIHASAGGVVVYAGHRSDYGQQVAIDHGNGFITRYSHASKINVKLGDIVVQGQNIALIGSTGRSTGPHLHFEIMKNDKFLNPAAYLNFFKG